MSKVFNSINRGLKEAIEYSKGKQKDAKVFRPTHIDVKNLEEELV